MYTLKNQNGAVKTVKNGFSWTIAFFGFFVPVFRADWKFAGIIFLTSLIGNLILPFVGGWIVMVIFAFKYNEWYLNDLLEAGYEII